jgi:predicted amidohydrolase YtcJ
MLHEGAAYSYNDTVVPAPSRIEWESAILEAQAHLHALGITGWQDAWVTPGTLAAYQALAADGRLTARVVGALWWDRHRGLEQIDDLLAQRERASGAHADSGVPGFFPTTVKIMTDGVLENYTGALLEPFCDGCGGHTDNHGLSYVDHDLLVEAVTRLDALGFQVHMHAIGDRAVRNALDAVEAARNANGATDNRHHIAHIQLVQPEDVPRFAQVGAVANCQTYWAKNDPQMEELTVPYLGAERVALQYPFEGIRAAGARLAMGSDWSVTTADPLTQLEVAITRSDPDDRGVLPFLPKERLTADDAFDAFTAGSAYLNHDDDAGTIALGNRADLAVLDIDVFEDGFINASRAPVDDASVIMTVAGGRVVHEV